MYANNIQNNKNEIEMGINGKRFNTLKKNQNF